MNLSGTDTNELLRRKSRILGILVAFLVLWVIMIACVIMIKEKRMVYLAPMFPLSLLFFPLFQQLKAIKAELKSRTAAEAQ
ncbi:hypothetical protein HF324_11560 [Chitinophaga oryzae]|uniref:Redox-active disulfide protein 2 n=1 Tax=Chitinophaga oryzae TaxID=2725414 RepID=A0AAE6ZFF5_9BACT|nr:hypothetical protein [Chitinophaga oryzae]QJB31990.1 hypothetical protein HF329_11885 [Chitinophaga oryzae]QJB38468.1 hypothetical protein HF324_11560 [Chitinophaga oryzae]